MNTTLIPSTLLHQATKSLLTLAAGVALFAGLTTAAHATDGAVYAMSNSTQGNEVLVFQRDEFAGTLTLKATVATGGQGTGSGLGNQGALAITADERWLLVVNPGSDSITSFAILEDGLQLVDTSSSGGKKPVSLDVHDGFVAILNAAGDVGGRDRVTLKILNADGTFGKLRGARYLSQDTTSPAQVKFVQDGHVIVVTEKDTAKIDTLRVRRNGTFGTLQVHDSVGAKPFGFTEVNRDHILVTDASLGTVTAYLVDNEGALEPVGQALNTTQLASCWAVATPGSRYVYTTNTQSGTVTGMHVNFDATLEMLNPDGITATTGAEPIDAALSHDGYFLYVLASGTDSIDIYHVAEDGSLATVTSQTGLPDGANGLVAR